MHSEVELAYEKEGPDALIADRKKYVAEMSATRAAVQKKLKKVITEREANAAKERNKLAGEADKATLGDAVVAAVIGFSFSLVFRFRAI